MKKLLLMFGLAFMMVGLTACGLLGDDEDPEAIAEDIVSNWDGTLSHLSAAQTSMNIEDSFEIFYNMTFEGEENDEEISFTINYTIRGARIDGVKTTEVIVEADFLELTGMDEDTSFKIHYIIEELDSSMNLYINNETYDLILDEMHAEDREMFENALDAFLLNETWVRFTFEDDMQNIIEIQILEDMLKDYDYEDMLEPLFGTSDFDSVYDEMEAAYDEIYEKIMKYTEFSYLDEFEHGDVTVEQTSDNMILTTIEMQGAMLAELFESMIKDMFEQLAEYDELYENPDEILEDPNYIEFKEELMTFKPALMEVLYDPVNYSHMRINIDATDTMNDFFDEMDDIRPMTEFSLTVEINDTATITLPTTFGDANQAAEEAGKLALIEEVRWLMDDAQRFKGEGTHRLDEITSYSFAIFDQELSTITVSQDTVTGTFYYVDGISVFNGAIQYSDFIDAYDNFQDQPNRVDLLTMINLVDDDTFSLTRFIAAAMIEELEQEIRRQARFTLEEQAYEIEDAAWAFCGTITAANEDYCDYVDWDHGARKMMTYDQLSPYLSSEFADLEFAVLRNHFGDFNIIIVTKDYYVSTSGWGVWVNTNYGYDFDDLYDMANWENIKNPE